MKEIRSRIDEYNLDDTHSLLIKNKMIIGAKIKELKQLEKTIDKQIQIIDNYREGSSEIQIKQLQEPRSVIYIKKDLTQNQSIDEIEMIRHFICSESLKNIPGDWFISGQFGVIYSEESERIYDMAFFYDGNNENADFILPPGKYASTMYKGTETSISREHLAKLVDYIDEHGWIREKKIFEIWQIDELYTLKEKDFVTEIQIYINKP
jgi:effector-binding domain-containing protein